MDLLEIALDSLRTSVLICGLVVVMMMLIESFNVESDGRVFKHLGKSPLAQVLLSALLGSLPGCVGGFAVVSLYTHRLLSFGALVAMMVATAGDESFLMLALFPDKAVWLLGSLFVLAVVVGLLVDLLSKSGKVIPTRLEDSFDLHDCAHGRSDDKAQAHKRGLSWKRVLMVVGVVVFVVALLAGFLEEGHAHEEAEAAHGGLNLLSEEWMFWLFGAASLFLLATLLLASDHFVEEHLWEHIVVRHLPSIFAWTMGVIFVIGVLFHFVDLKSWIEGNPILMILIAIAVGLIPESGPNLVFVTLFASGIIPFPVLLANSIVQDGHASLPLLADSKLSFLKAKLLKVALALVVLGFLAVFGLLF